MKRRKNTGKSNVLKYALFATGLSGIVAEYILSTLASYFIGNAIIQFTLIVSIMLFSMGLGSRLSQWVDRNLIEVFIITEMALSLLASFSAIIVYLTYSSTNFSWVLIYSLSIIIGLLIGLEIPLVTRINNRFESLRVNIASVLEKDYYGSLVGGLFFAFVGLPHLGLTYTPFVLGFINFGVAVWVFFQLKDLMEFKNYVRLQPLLIGVGICLLAGVFFAKPILLFGEQKKYRDRVVFQEQTKYQKIVITQWEEEHSLYINGNHQLSSFDEFLYHEPMVHSVMNTAIHQKRVLVLGGGDGCAVREILKYPEVEQITLVDLDEIMVNLGKEHPVFQEMNGGVLNHPKVQIRIEDAFQFLEKKSDRYDVIIIDLPDPNDIDLNKLYSKEFYFLCRKRLNPGGALITQAGSPYYATKAYYCIGKTMQSAGFNTLNLHNQVLTMGQWGWVLGSQQLKEEQLLTQLKAIDLETIPLRWLNKAAIPMITSFGKPLADTSDLKINTIFSPILHEYYRKGNWTTY